MNKLLSASEHIASSFFAYLILAILVLAFIMYLLGDWDK